MHQEEIDVCLAGSPARNSRCGDPVCICAPHADRNADILARFMPNAVRSDALIAAQCASFEAIDALAIEDDKAYDAFARVFPAMLDAARDLGFSDDPDRMPPSD